MTDEDFSTDEKPINRGRTWADVFVGATYITGAVIFLILMAIGVYFIVGDLPAWFFIAILGSLIFVPFLMERAKDGSELFIVSNEPFKLTEYRIGRRVGLEIYGNGVQFQSKSGIYRTYLTDLDIETKTAKGTPFGDLTQIDQVRDMNTLKRAIEGLEENLRESRISSQEVGIAVERQSIEIVDWALKTIYGAIIPTEISEAFGMEEKKEALDVEEILEVEDELNGSS